MKNDKKIIIIGGGLAGLTAAIHLSKQGFEVMIIEKNEFPKHKVCGEYISNEVISYFNWLDIDIEFMQPTHIKTLQFSTAKGKMIQTTLPLGGFGVSRYALDLFLYNKALANGCTVIQETVNEIIFENNQHIITTNSNCYNAHIVIGAFGKRSNIDVKLNRNFIKQKSHWLAVKSHYSGNFPQDLVGLHNFNGGYCGVSKVENNAINICYLANFKTFKQYKNITEYQNDILSKNPHLKTVFEHCKPIFEKPLTISQISFEPKKAIENNIIMIGDTAGLIHPLSGNGMAMAIHSAKIAASLIEKYYDNQTMSRKKLETEYIKLWNYNFKNRLKTGRILSALMRKSILSEIIMNILIIFPFLLVMIIKKTHGKPIL